MNSGSDSGDGDPWAESVRIAKSRFVQIEPERLRQYIEEQSDVRGPVIVSDFETLVDGAGLSNGIAFFSAALDRGNGAEQASFVLRYSPGFSLIKQKSFADEYLTIRAAAAADIPVPAAFWPDFSGDRPGTPCFAMDRIWGEAPPTSMYTSGVLARATPEQRREMMLQAAEFQGLLRKTAIGPDQVPHLMRRGIGGNAIERELSWWMAEARLNAKDKFPKIRLISDVYGWLMVYQPKARPATLAHGDGQVSNIMFRDGRAVAWLDWELAHLGYQETDLWLLIMQTELTLPPGTGIEGVPTESDYISRYERASGHGVEHWEYFKLFMIYKYLVSMLFVYDVMPAADAIWARLVDYLDRIWPQARAAAGR